MAPSILPSDKVTLTYPLYAVEFANDGRLVVGGGGGAGRSGVGNKITVLRAEDVLREEAEVDLSKDEDNVTSLAVGATAGQDIPIYAGINSSPKDVTKGENKHFRLFQAAGGKSSRKITEKSRSTFFALKDKDAYQRVTRLSKPFGVSQLGVIATGFAKKSEVVVFDAKDASPTIREQIQLPDGLEAEDADVIQTGPDEYSMVYVTKKSLWYKQYSKNGTQEDVQNIFTIPRPEDPPAHPPVMNMRSVRFLTGEFVLCMMNIADRGGVTLQVLRLPSKDNPKVRTAAHGRVPAEVRQATGLAITCLSPPNSPGDKVECAQFVVAVASQNTSIVLLSLEYQTEQGISIFANFRPRLTLPSVHPLQMTGIALSSFEAPKDGKDTTLKLASVSVANTVVTHTIPVTTTTFGSKSGKARYVLDIPAPSRPLSFWIISSLIVLLISFITQAGMEISGSASNRVGAKSWMPSWQQAIFLPVHHTQGVVEKAQDRVSSVPSSVSGTSITSTATIPTAMPSTETEASTPFSDVLSSLLATQTHESGSHADHVIFLREEDTMTGEGTDVNEPASIKADLHHEDTHGPHGGKTWDELDEHQRKAWTEKLKELGHSAEDLGATVLKGIVFGTIGGVIGAAVA